MIYVHRGGDITHIRAEDTEQGVRCEVLHIRW